MRVILGLDTATYATAAALMLADGSVHELRDDPDPGVRPRHGTHLLALASELLDRHGLSWDALEGVAVGLGPGTFTGLRIGIAAARGLAQSLRLPLTGVPSMSALALGAFAERKIWSEQTAQRRRVLCVLDARRGEVFVAAYADRDGGQPQEIISPSVVEPADLASLPMLEQDARSGQWLAIGDGALRFASALSAAGIELAPASSPAHRVSASAICLLAQQIEPASEIEEVLPIYGRRPDAELAMDARRGALREGAVLQ